MVFGSNDYLGLGCDLPSYSTSHSVGFGAGASRLVTGTHDSHADLENALADWLEVEKTLLFNSGYNANTGVFAALFGPEDVIFSDSLNHASLIDGIRLCKAKRVIYPHGDVGTLGDQLKAHEDARFRVIVSDSLFSMDGDLAPISQIVALAEELDAIVVLDEAHALGVLGSEGRGACEQARCTEKVDIRIGTCGKAMGTFGAFVAGSRALCNTLFNGARSVVFTTALPPPLADTTRRNLAAVRAEDRRVRLWQNVRTVRAFLSGEGIDVSGSAAQIIPLIVGDSDTAVRVSEQLFEAGIWIPAIRPPTVADGTARLRLTVSAAHDDRDLDRLFSAIKAKQSVLA